MALAKKTGLSAGDNIAVETPAGKRELKIAGQYNDYTAGGMTLLVQMDTAKQLLGIEGVTTYILKVDPARLSDTEAPLRAICERDGLMLQSPANLHKFVNQLLAGLVGGLWVLLGLGFLVASFGIVNTLTMNVLEQTRELALLRAIAMTRRQLRRMIICQAAIIGLIGLVPGTLAGAVMAYLMNTGTLPIIGHPIQFHIQPQLVLATFFCALLMVLGAAWLPALRASRLKVISALKLE